MMEKRDIAMHRAVESGKGKLEEENDFSEEGIHALCYYST